MKRTIALTLAGVSIASVIAVSTGAQPNAPEAVLAAQLTHDDRPALPSFDKEVDFASVCGTTNEQQDVEAYDGTLGVTKAYVATYEKPIVQLQWLDARSIRRAVRGRDPGNVAGERWCTGSLIDANTILTAGHCLDIQTGVDRWVTPFSEDDNGRKDFVEPEQLARLMKVNFNYQKEGSSARVRPGRSFPITQMTEYRLDGLDMAILKIGADSSGKMPSAYGYQPRKMSNRAVRDQERLAIIQHPQGKPKKIEAGTALTTVGSRLFYGDIDTHGGASGSPILDGEGVIVGIHTHGGCHANGGANRGVTLTAATRASPTLRTILGI